MSRHEPGPAEQGRNEPQGAWAAVAWIAALAGLAALVAAVAVLAAASRGGGDAPPIAAPPPPASATPPPTPAPTATATPAPPPPVAVTPGGEEVPRLAPMTIAFRDPPAEDDGARLVALDPPVEGVFAWADDRTLLFQPAFPGWTRGQRYRLLVDASAAGLAEDHAHAFTAGGRLEVAYVIPGDGDREVPAAAQVLVQFSRSVAPLTVLQEGPGKQPLEFDPPLAGKGEWLNTSLYRFAPSDLRPGAVYRVRVPAGLTSAADGVLEEDFAWSFATWSPAVTGIDPADRSIHVEPRRSVVLRFNQPMNRASVEAGVVLREPLASGGSLVAVSFAWSDDDATVTLTPAEPLAVGTDYEVVAPAGLLGATGGASTRSRRTVAFTTIERPRLVGTAPSDGATDAGRRGITLQYNNPLDAESFDGRIAISGVDPDDFGWYVNYDSVYIPLPLRYETSYEVTIAEGVRDRVGQTLPAASFSFTTRAPPPEVRVASVSFAVYGDFATYSANADQTLYYHARHAEEVRFRLYRLPRNEADLLLNRGWIDEPRWQEKRKVFWPTSDPIREWAREIEEPLRDARRIFSASLGSGAPLPKGDYFLAVTAHNYTDEDAVHKLVFSVVDTAIVTKLAFDELLVWALDYETGEPLAGADVTASAFSLRPGGTTNADGLARIAVPKRSYDKRVVRIEDGGRYGVATTSWRQGIDPWLLDVPTSFYADRLLGYLYTDRPIYRPGETVYYKGVVRRDDDASNLIPGPDERLDLAIRDPGWDEIQQTSVRVNRLGTFAGEFVLPADARTGTYRISFVEPNRYYWYGSIASTSFTVAEFRVPEFEVEARTPREHYVDGERIEAEARASFFFGGPVEGASVEWAALASPAAMRVEGYEGYSFTERDYWYDYWRPAVVERPLRAAGAARTDAAGVARFGVAAALEAGEGAQRFTLSATVTDASGQAVAGSTEATVHPAAFYAGIRPESYVATAGEPTAVNLVTVDIEGAIAPLRPVTVRVYEREWVTTKERSTSGRFTYRSEPVDTLIETRAATTDADGEASIAFTPPAAGSYRLVAESVDDEGRAARAARFLWVSGGEAGGSRRASWRVRNDDVIALIADREQYEVGDVAEVLVPTPYEDAVGLVTIERGRVLSSEVRAFPTNSETLLIPILDAHLPNVYVGVVLYRAPTEEDPLPRYHVGYVELPVSTAPRRLDVSIEPDRERAAPGETVRYEVRVTDHEGKGVEAEVSVAVVDRAVLSLADEVDADGLRAFWFQRPLGVATASSLAVSMDRANDAFRETEEGGKGGDGGDGDGGEAYVRRKFENTALWIGQLETDADGRAGFELRLPDNATTWRAQARAVSGATQVGEGESELLVTRPLLVRPALPRFLRVGDEATLRALVRNGTTADRDVTVTIEAEGVALDAPVTQHRRVPADGSAAFEWPARAPSHGEATLRFRADADGGHADAVEIAIPVHLDVTPETTATNGVAEDAPAVEAVYLPDYAITEFGSLEIALQGSLIGALDEELPKFAPLYRESYERVASRIVATAAVQRTRAGLDRGLSGRIGTDVTTLVAAQRYNGGWPWCPRCDHTSIWVTGWVLVALAEARDTGQSIPGSTITDAVRLVSDHVRERMNRRTDVLYPPNPNEHAFLLYALTRGVGPATANVARLQAGAMRSLVEQHRDGLANWARAYLTLALLATGHAADSEPVRALVNDLTANTIASANGNHWEDGRGGGSMHGGSVRTTALVLRALVAAAPRHPLIEETARWLTLARATGWQTTVGRAQAMSTLSAFASLTGEAEGVYDYEVWVNADRVLDGRFDVPRDDYLDGTALDLDGLPLGEVSLLRFQREPDGEGRLYYGLNLRYVTPAQGIEALNRGFAVSREYSLLEEPDRAVSGAALGDVVRVRVTVIAPADRIYAVVEDLLPAGLEPIDPRLRIVAPELREQLAAEQSEAFFGERGGYYAPWYGWYYSPWDQVDIRDDRVVLSATRLPRGVHEYVYFARATTPGDFFVAPAHASETYFPEVFGRSDSSRFGVAGAAAASP